jgi:hypothetical protein
MDRAAHSFRKARTAPPAVLQAWYGFGMTCQPVGRILSAERSGHYISASTCLSCVTLTLEYSTHPLQAVPRGPSPVALPWWATASAILQAVNSYANKIRPALPPWTHRIGCLLWSDILRHPSAQALLYRRQQVARSQGCSVGSYCGGAGGAGEAERCQRHD